MGNERTERPASLSRPRSLSRTEHGGRLAVNHWAPNPEPWVRIPAAVPAFSGTERRGNSAGAYQTQEGKLPCRYYILPRLGKAVATHH